MPPYVYPLPTTSLLTFSSVFIDPSSSHTTVLADATSARTRLQLALKAVVDDEPGSRALGVVEAVQVYLPYLRGIVAALDADRLLYKNDPIFPWRSPLTQYTMSAPLLPLPSIHCEHVMVLLTYVLALSNYAAAILGGLPKFEPKQGDPSRHMSTEDEKRTTAGLARAVDLLCQAAGIAEWTSENVLPSLDSVKTISGGRAGKQRWPIEAGPEFFRGISMTLLADAHVTAIRKLLLPILPHTLFAPPGPPLPSNHPSPSLLSKLYLHVAKLYDSSRALFKAHANEPSSSNSRRIFRGEKIEEPDSAEGELNSGFKRYLKKEAMLSQALAHKWLGVDAGENGKGARIGEAVAWCKDAQTRLEVMEDGAVREKMKGLGLGKLNDRKKEERKARKSRVERDLEDISAWVKSYARQNDTVSFQPVPAVGSLTIPSGRPIFAAKAFSPPSAPVGFGQENDEDGVHDTTAKASEGSYAGQGTYF